MFEFSSIEQYHAQLKNGDASCKQAVEHFFKRINASKDLNAFIEVHAEEAFQKAIDLDKKRSAGEPIGLLHGVVIGLKDIIAYKDHGLTASSKILEGFISIYSATVVERLLKEEAIIIGDCNCDEFAMGSTNENSVYGKVLNALDKTRIPGGSSGGSAVAVQAGLCMVSLGSDTGGSVRQPADFCDYSSALLIDQYRKWRFTYFHEALNHPSLDKEIAASIKTTINELIENGHKVEPAHFEYIDYIVPAYYVLTTAEASSNLSRYDGVRYGYRTKESVPDLTEFYKLTRSEGFGKEVKRRIMLGTFVLSTGYYDAYFTKAQQVRQLLVKKTEAIFSEYDFILMPTSPAPAFKIGEKMNDPIAMYLADIFTVMANLVGCPAVSIPLYKHSSGMPFGLQVMAKRFNELPLLEVSQQLMSRSD